MGWVIALVIILGIVALDVAMLNNTRLDETPNVPYARSAHLFSPDERSFLQVLDQVVGGNARVFGKVHVADVVVPGEGMTRSSWKEAYRKVSGHRFDFLLCNTERSVSHLRHCARRRHSPPDRKVATDRLS